MTKGENEFFQILTKILQNKYYIFPQMHLTTFLEHKVTGQTWKGAKAHIDRLSVDYVICDKKYLSPIIAIELDDSTHNRGDRIVRDTEVERILQEAKVPLIRIPYTDRFKEEEIKEKIFKYLKSN